MLLSYLGLFKVVKFESPKTNAVNVFLYVLPFFLNVLARTIEEVLRAKIIKSRETGHVFRAFFCGCHVPVCYVTVVVLEDEGTHTQAFTGEFHNGRKNGRAVNHRVKRVVYGTFLKKVCCLFYSFGVDISLSMAAIFSFSRFSSSLSFSIFFFISSSSELPFLELHVRNPKLFSYVLISLRLAS